LISDIPGQRTATVEYHFSNVTPNNVAWRFSCRVQ
jgi:hypothetical protein